MVEWRSLSWRSNSRATAGDSESRSHLGKEIRQIKIDIAEGLNEFSGRPGFRVSEIDLVVQLFAQRAPVEIDEGMFLGDFLDDVVGDAGAVAETSEMELLHFSAAAHIVHQIVGVPLRRTKAIVSSKVQREAG